MQLGLCCTKCGETVIKSMSGQETKLRAKVLVFKNDQAFAVCKGCGNEIPVPLSIDTSMLKSLEETKARLKLWVKKY